MEDAAVANAAGLHLTNNASPSIVAAAIPAPGGTRSGFACSYWLRWGGVPGYERPAAQVAAIDVLLAGFGCLVGIGALAACNDFVLGGASTVDSPPLQLLTASFGASAALIYGAPSSPLSQPRNMMLGHVLSAIIGVAVRILIVEDACDKRGHNCAWLGAGLAVALSIMLMMATRTLHPPGGGTALAAVTGGPVIAALGFYFVLMPIAVGAAFLLIVALVVNNVRDPRRYPLTWR